MGLDAHQAASMFLLLLLSPSQTFAICPWRLEDLVITGACGALDGSLFSASLEKAAKPVTLPAWTQHSFEGLQG